MKQWKVGDNASTSKWQKRQKMCGYLFLPFCDPVQIMAIMPVQLLEWEVEVAIVMDINRDIGMVGLDWLDPWEEEDERS